MGREPAANIHRIETKLANFVREYLRAISSGSAGDQEEALRWVCSAFEHLLGELLDGSQGWCGWVDGIEPAFEHFPNAVTVVSDVEISIRGRADWARSGGGPCWVEPFHGIVRIAESEDLIESYELLFSDEERGLGRTEFGKHIRRSDWYFPKRWGYRFKKPE